MVALGCFFKFYLLSKTIPFWMKKNINEVFYFGFLAKIIFIVV